MDGVIILSIAVAVIALIFALIKALIVKSKPAGTEKMQELMHIIHKGALSFLGKEYQILIIFVIAVFLILGLVPSLGWNLAIAFVVGAFLSALAGNIGMRIATL